MGKCYRCAEFVLEVPDDWEQQVVHLAHQADVARAQVMMIEAPSAYHSVPEHWTRPEVANHVAEYLLAKTTGHVEWTKIRALDEHAQLTVDDQAPVKGALGHEIEYTHAQQPGKKLVSRQIHVVRGPLYVRLQIEMPTRDAGEHDPAWVAMRESLRIVPQPVLAARWVDPEQNLPEQPPQPLEVPPLELDKSTMPVVHHPKVGHESVEPPRKLDPGRIRKRLDYILMKEPGSSRDEPEQADEEEIDTPGTQQARLDRFLRYSTGPVSASEEGAES